MQPSTEWREVITPDEDARFSRYADELRTFQRKRARGKAASRALHAKGQLGLLAELEVLPNLPEHLRQSMFAEPARYRAYVRYSNGSGAHQSDKTPDVRGIAVKLVGVPGKKIIPGMEDVPTQDFLLIGTPATPVKDADEFLALVRAAATPALLPIRLMTQLGPARGIQLLRDVVRGLGVPMTTFSTKRYYTALPLAYGAYAAKLSLVPHDANGTPMPKDASPDHLAEEMIARLTKGPVAYDLRVQLFVDEKTTPIEDASIVWPEDIAPFATIARLVIPAQDPRSPRGQKVAAFVEKLAFDPWHARADLRPLGNMMRARNHAYRASTEERGAADEPTGDETF